MKKRIFAFFIAVVCLLALTACGGNNKEDNNSASTGGENSSNSANSNNNESTPQVDPQPVIDAVNKSKALKQVDMTLNVTSEGEEVPTPSDSTTRLKSDNTDSSNPTFMIINKTYLSGKLSNDVVLTYKDGYYYAKSAGNYSSKTKSKTDAGQAERMKLNYVQASNISISEESFDHAKVTQDGGNTIYTVELAAGENFLSTETYIINSEGYLTKYSYQAEKKSGGKVVVSGGTTVEYHNPGKDVKISYPSDLKSYKDIAG